WRAANDIVCRLQVDEAGHADNPTLTDVDPSLRGARERLLNDNVFRRSLGVVPIDIKLVELDRLIVPQKHINMNNVRRLQSHIDANADPSSIFNVCMALEHQRENVRCMRATNDSFVFVSPSHDLRFLDAFLLDPSEVHCERGRGILASAVGLMIGYSMNCMA